MFYEFYEIEYAMNFWVFGIFRILIKFWRRWNILFLIGFLNCSNFWNFDQILGKMKYSIFESFFELLYSSNNRILWSRIIYYDFLNFGIFLNFDQILEKMKYSISESFFELFKFYETQYSMNFWVFRIFGTLIKFWGRWNIQFLNRI